MRSSSQPPPLAIDGDRIDLEGLEAVARRGRAVVVADAARAVCGTLE
jgi:hypothetical protein